MDIRKRPLEEGGGHVIWLHRADVLAASFSPASESKSVLTLKVSNAQLAEIVQRLSKYEETGLDG